MAQLTPAALKEGLLIQVGDDVSQDKREYIGEPGTRHLIVMKCATHCIRSLYDDWWWLTDEYIYDFDVVHIPDALLLT